MVCGFDHRPTFTGVWKSNPAKTVNYEEFLAFQGVPWAKRKIGNSASMTHIFEHNGNILKLEVSGRACTCTIYKTMGFIAYVPSPCRRRRP